MLEMNSRETCRILREVGWLARQPDAFVRAIIDAAEVVEAPRGDLLYSLDSSTGGLYGILSGHVEVVVAPGPVEPMLVHLGGPGWWVGEAALVTRTPRRAELRARTDVRALYVPVAGVERIAGKDQSTWRRLSEITVDHMDNALSLATSLATRDLGRRLSMTLMRLAGPLAETSKRVVIPVAQGELGEMAGLSRNTVVRQLSTLKRAGAIESGYGQIVVNVEALRSVLA